MKKSRIALVIAIAVPIVVALGVIFMVKAKNNSQPAETAEKTKTKIKQNVNTIPIEERPYVTLQPLSSRNDLEITIYNRKLAADTVAVTLEYDRNKGILDAVLKTINLTKDVQTEKLFMGSKSAGGHITYHDDVVGGSLYLEFSGDNEYNLEVPWRYQDTEPRYSQLSSADGKFQVELDEPIKATKVIVMQSPGLPDAIDQKVLAGPYLVRTVGDLLKTTATIKIRLTEEASNVVLYGWDGETWQEIDSTVDGKTVTGSGPFYQAYIVTQK